MSNNEIQIKIKVKDEAAAKIAKLEAQLAKLGKSTKQTGTQMSGSLDDTIEGLDALGNRFRYLSLVSGIFAGAMIAMTKGLLDTAREAQNAELKVNAFAQITGQSGNEAYSAAKKFVVANKGIISLTESSNTLANLLASGMSIDKATLLMQGMLDTASLSKESLTDTMGKALEKSSLGVRILQERQVDAIGINFRADQVWGEYGKTIKKTSAQMSTQEKQQAIINYLTQETSKFAGGAATATQTFSGSVSGLQANMEMLKISLGNALIPLFGEIADKLSSAALSLARFAEAHTGLTFVIITGSTILATFIAALATVGALIPMVVRGAKLSTKAMTMLGAATAMTSLKFIILAAVIGGIIYLILKVTGVWDKWTDKIKDISKIVQSAIKPMDDFGESAEEMSAKTLKQIEQIKHNMFLATRDYNEGMAMWVKKHDESIKDIKDQIEDLRKKYNEETDKITSGFNRSMEDVELRHRRKVEDLQRDIDEEVSKGIWADQTKIRENRLALKRENEDYARATKQNIDTKDKDLEDSKDKFSERLKELEDRLAEEQILYDKHAEAIKNARLVPLLDEIELQKRQWEERMSQLKDQLDELTKLGDAQSLNNKKTQSTRDLMIESSEKTIAYFQAIRNNGTEMTRQMKSASWQAENLKKILEREESFAPVLQGPSIPGHELPRYTRDTGANSIWDDISSFVSRIQSFLGIRGYAKGGIIPGQPGQAVPILAHGGETVLPAGVAPVTININNPTVRNNNDIRLIANAVKDVLSRETYLKQFK